MITCEIVYFSKNIREGLPCTAPPPPPLQQRPPPYFGLINFLRYGELILY